MYFKVKRIESKSAKMRILLSIFFLVFYCKTTFAQKTGYIVSPILMAETPTEEEIKLSETTDLQSILSLIYSPVFIEKYLSKIPSAYPLDKQISVTSHYGVRQHPVHQVLKFHKGTDLKGQTGEIVLASGDGMVIQTGFDEHLGNFIKVQHSYGFESIYGHLSKISIKKGQKITQGMPIGKVGATGTVTGPHLHYTIKKNGVFLDPFEFIYLSIVENP